jgi:hypothetical protein
VPSAFLVQAAGASMASGDNLTESEIMRGLHIYMIGVGVQEAFIIAFTGLLIRFQLRFKRESPHPNETLPLRLVYTLYTVLGLITIRIIFRLIEYSSGIDSSIPTHEVFTFVFETLPMFVALLLFNIVHPGRVMPGRENNIPGRKQRKRMIKEGLLPGKKSALTQGSDTELGLTASSPARASYSEPQYGVVEGYESYRHL